VWAPLGGLGVPFDVPGVPDTLRTTPVASLGLLRGVSSLSSNENMGVLPAILQLPAAADAMHMLGLVHFEMVDCPRPKRMRHGQHCGKYLTYAVYKKHRDEFYNFVTNEWTVKLKSYSDEVDAKDDAIIRQTIHNSLAGPSIEGMDAISPISEGNNAKSLLDQNLMRPILEYACTILAP